MMNRLSLTNFLYPRILLSAASIGREREVITLGCIETPVSPPSLDNYTSLKVLTILIYHSPAILFGIIYSHLEYLFSTITLMLNTWFLQVFSLVAKLIRALYGLNFLNPNNCCFHSFQPHICMAIFRTSGLSSVFVRFLQRNRTRRMYKFVKRDLFEGIGSHDCRGWQIENLQGGQQAGDQG